MMFKRCNHRNSRRISSRILILLLLWSAFAFAEDKEIFTFSSDYFVDSSFITQSSHNDSATISFTTVFLALKNAT
jgi:hypothetical protein